MHPMYRLGARDGFFVGATLTFIAVCLFVCLRAV